MDKSDRPGIFRRAGAWVVAAAATSLVASLATLPFALHHFDRAALFSVFANIISTPVISLWTTPAAAVAALAATVGLDEPFLWLMGQSLEVVLYIAHVSAETSPDIDVPRLDGTGMALAGGAIALFCVLARRGKWFAAIPAAAAVAVWLTTPQAVGYVADDGSVFLQQDKGWIELTDWRDDNGLNPLIIGDDIRKSPCPGKGGSCWIDMAEGQTVIVPLETMPAGKCPVAARLVLNRVEADASLEIDPCAFAGSGGAVILSDGQRYILEPARASAGRAWEQPLYAKRDVVKYD